MSPRQAYRSAGDTVVDLVAGIPIDAYPGAGLGEWDLRALVGHTARAFTTVTTYLAQPAESEDLASAATYLSLAGSVKVDPVAVHARGVEAGAALGDDPASAVRGQRDAALAALDAAGDDDLVRCIGGGIRVASYLPTRTLELVVHGLDVARATDLPADFDPEVLEAVLALAGQVAVRTDRGPELLLALTGRESLGDGFSVV